MSLPVVVALDSFKGTIGSAAAAEAVAAGWRAVHPHDDVRVMPMADGGEGTLDAFAAAVPGATRVPVTATGPEDAAVEASWLRLPATADAPDGTGVVELASTSGIELLGTPPRLRPLDAHTLGFGEAIAAALERGVSRLVLGIGSSASTDGGVGLLTAIGARFLDAAGQPIPLGGRGLASLTAIDLTGLAALPPGGVTVLTDVTSPLTGPDGAAAVFGPQKGATVADIALLDEGLARLAGLLGVDPRTPGAGAAGGAGFGLLAWGARLVPGAEAVAALIGLTEAVGEASVVVTGEGSYDGQSAAGKAPAIVAALAAAAGTPVALVAGAIEADAATDAFAATVSLTELAGSCAAAMDEPERWLQRAGAMLAERLGVGPADTAVGAVPGRMPDAAHIPGVVLGAGVVKRSTHLADGRELIYFDDPDTTLGPERAVDARVLDPRPETATMRRDVLTGDWVSIAAARQNRAFLPPAERDPLAPQTPANPSEIPSMYDVAVFENRSPSFGPALAATPAAADANDLEAPGIGSARTAIGRCEVVCFSPEHSGSFGTQTRTRARTVIEAWADRTAVLSALAGVEQVFPFENRGEEIGVTLPHPHGQIYAYPYVTPRTQALLASIEREGADLFDRILAFERASERVVLAGEHWTAFVPFAARWPIEVHLLPHRHVPDFAATSAGERDELASLYLRLLRGIDALYGTPTPYIAAWHQAPVHRGRDTARLHLQLTSPRRAADKLKFLAGSEAAMGAWIGDIPPEVGAARLRAALETIPDVIT